MELGAFYSYSTYLQNKGQLYIRVKLMLISRDYKVQSPMKIFTTKNKYTMLNLWGFGGLYTLLLATASF